MRPLFVLLALTALAGCASTVPPPPPPPEVVLQPPPAPAPVPVQVETVPMETGPPEPPAVLERVIAQRSVYESDRVAEWTLDNGLTVLYAWDDGAAEYTVRASVPGDRLPGDQSGDRATEPVTLAVGLHRHSVTARASRLDEAVAAAVDALGGAAPAGAVVLLHGGLGPEWVEPVVAEQLGRLRRRLAPAAPPTRSVLDADWSDLPALLVVAQVLRERSAPSDPLALVFDPATGDLRLEARASSRRLLDAWLAPAAPDVLRSARDAAAAAARQPAGVLLALDALYQLPGAYRPARPVADARALADRVARATPEQAGALLARLSAANPRLPASNE